MFVRQGVSTAVAAVMASAAPAAWAQEPVELRVWDQFTDVSANRAAEAVYAAFEEAHPEIDVVREVYSYDQIRTIARTALASDTGPDVIYHEVGVGNAGVLADADLIMSLEDYAAEYGWKDRLQQSAIEEGSLGGDLYGLGLEFEFFGVFYNADLLEELDLSVPTTLEETLDYCAAAREAGHIPYALNLNPGWQAYHLTSAVVYDVLGAEAANALIFEGEGSWDSPEIAEALNIAYVQMRDAECYPFDVNALLYDDAAALFYSGEAVGWPTGTWSVGRIAENMPDTNVEVHPFPSVAGDDTRYLPTGVGSAYYIATATEHPDEAAVFLDFLFSQEAANIWAEEAGFIPPVPVDLDAIDVPPLFEDALQTLSEAGREPGDPLRTCTYINHFVPADFVSSLRDGPQAVVAGTQTPEELAAQFQRQWADR